MEIKRLEQLPEGFDGESTAFDDYDLRNFRAFGPEKLWYWYATRPYEGSGQAIMLKDGKYYLKGCGHCSCYGPGGRGISDDTFTMEDCAAFETLDALAANCSTGYYAREVGCLVEFVRANP